jgi:predicted dehydrogenase
VSALCDQVQSTARREANRWGCDTAAGPTELLERPDVDALLLVDRQWFGLWPLEVACRLGKPVFCRAALLLKHEPHPDCLVKQVQQSGLRVMVGLPMPRPVILARLELCAGQVGAPRLLLGSLFTRRRASLNMLGPLLSWCAALLGDAPEQFLATAAPGGEVANLLLDYGNGLAAQLTVGRLLAGPRSWQLQLVGERGCAVIEPGQLRWQTSDGPACQALPRCRRGPRVFLEAFHEALATDQVPQPGLTTGLRLCNWLCLAGRSLAEGSWVCPDSAGAIPRNS